ncbi:MAG: polysaccharide export protein, partial [Xanthobacteraceae bacterium]|nr:polysaccharide export protein [Xanthobacteraceae bacterium]
MALGGCVHRTGPVASGPVGGGLDAIAYGSPPVVRTPSPVAYRPPSAPVRSFDAPYRLDSGDRLRVVVYGQEGLTNTYTVGADGTITMPLIGTVPARGQTPSQLAQGVAARLRKNFIRDPYVAAEIETYRPFFILGEVVAPGQYPYVPNMTAESAVAIAGGFSPRARRDLVTIT